jgi:DNA-binding NarL/FixJ family response regulator
MTAHRLPDGDITFTALNDVVFELLDQHRREVRRAVDRAWDHDSDRDSDRRTAPDTPLTTRQVELLGYVADGYTNLQIAHRMSLAEGTVRKHLNNIYSRLGVSSRTAAVGRVFH